MLSENSPCPMKMMLGYMKRVKSFSSGSSGLHVEFACYSRVLFHCSTKYIG